MGGGLDGGLSMNFFTPRERAALGKSAEIRGQGRARELVRHDFAPRARPRPAEPQRAEPQRAEPQRAEPQPAESDISGHVGTLVTRVAASSMQEIDELIFRLHERREQLINESARVQREIIAYAALSQTTMESTRMITESLAQFNKAPDFARTSDDTAVQDVPVAEERAAEPPAQGADAGATDVKVEAASEPERGTATTGTGHG